MKFARLAILFTAGEKFRSVGLGWAEIVNFDLTSHQMRSAHRNQI